MNMAANPDKMAVTDNQSTIPVQGSESKEENDVRHQGKTINDKKKSTFKITSVTKNLETADLSNDADHDVEHDSMDDLDETVESHTEDVSSEILDISKHTDGGELASPMEEETSDNVTKENVVSHVSSTKETTQKSEQTNSNVKETHVKNKDKTDQQGPHSTRFKVVKIETREPFKRGRWTCLDTLDYPAPDKSDTKINIADSSALSSVNSTHHIGSMVDNPLKNPAKAANVIQGESKENFHGDNYQNSLTTHQSQPSSQSQIQQTSVSSNVQSNVAQQQIQTHQLPSNFHSSTIHSQPISNVNTSFAQGQSSMQTSDKPQTSYVYDSSAIWQMPNAIQTISNTDKSVKFNQEQFVSHHNSVIPNVDNKELDSVMSRTIGANIQQNSTNIEVQGAILTPQSVAEVVGMIPSPQEEDRNTRNFSAISPLTPGARGSSTVAIDNKIEQAMDLVKSHLMYAVREEVEVLKEQIKELMDKNSQLEYENQILKNSASPETLAKLSNLPPSSSS